MDENKINTNNDDVNLEIELPDLISLGGDMSMDVEGGLLSPSNSENDTIKGTKYNQMVKF